MSPATLQTIIWIGAIIILVAFSLTWRRKPQSGPASSEWHITCKVCDRGALLSVKVRRLSGPAVAIGYLLLVPSVIVMAICSATILASVLGALSGDRTGMAVGSAVDAFSTFIGVSAFIGGLLGWLLIMKKRVLKCSFCSATVNVH
jgi:hypothetical protein